MSYASTGIAFGHSGGSCSYRATKRSWNFCVRWLRGSNWSMPTQPSNLSKPIRYHMNAVLMIRGGSHASSSSASRSNPFAASIPYPMYASASAFTWRRWSRLSASRSGLWLTVSTAASDSPCRRHSWRKNRKYSSPFGEISLSTAIRW